MQDKISLYACGRYTTVDMWENAQKDFLELGRLYYVNSGWAKIYNGSKEYILKQGNIYLISKFQSLKMGESQNFNHTYFDFRYLYNFRADTFMEIDATKSGILPIIEFINTIITDNDVLYKNEKYLKTLEKALDTIIEYTDSKYALPLIKNDIIIKSLDIISKNYMDISVKELTGILNINESHFIRLFKKHTGITPKKHIQTYRLTNGMEMLKKGMSVSDVSSLCGYSTPSSFSYAFKKSFGISPSSI